MKANRIHSADSIFPLMCFGKNYEGFPLKSDVFFGHSAILNLVNYDFNLI